MDHEKIVAELESRGIAYPKGMFSIGDGWIPIVLAALDKMIAAGWDRDLGQVKEKFGGLRLYIGEASKEVFDIVDETERACWKACESCGSTSDVETKPSPGWIMTLCSKCRGGGT